MPLAISVRWQDSREKATMGIMKFVNDVIDRILDFLADIDGLLVGVPPSRNK